MIDHSEHIKVMDEVKRLTSPIAEYIRKNFDPHTTIVVTDTHARVLSDDFGIPLEIEAEAIT